MFYGMGFALLGLGALAMLGIGVAYLIVKTEQVRLANSGSPLGYQNRKCRNGTPTE